MQQPEIDNNKITVLGHSEGTVVHLRLQSIIQIK
jgi:hypothetical protein